MNALIDLHTHTIASGHAYSTLKENIEEASRKGILVLGTSDHSICMPGGPNEFFFENYKTIKNQIMGVQILRGIEANIINYDGNIDVNQKMIKYIDYVIASLHSHCIDSGSIQENTRAIVGAMKNPYVKIIGHPDDDRFKIDYDIVVESAKKYKVALELNNSSLLDHSARLNGRKNAKEMLLKAIKNEVYIIMGSDSHIYYDVGRFDEAQALLREVEFPERFVINYNLDRLKEVLRQASG
ncbi:histidinol phosphatase [Clostridium aceticum]|uniref:Histidinol phosphatase n=1 Tax=Clostridium aceticum TaxID=84022 RepID=A0A0D8I898_9CLOT|nr:phosphatase [Clostridium aceticum]AKL97275.1 histidinol phosphatase [Clostridium aceticum]KJF26299.1 hydrolase [Clostridium aceticum]